MVLAFVLFVLFVCGLGLSPPMQNADASSGDQEASHVHRLCPAFPKPRTGGGPAEMGAVFAAFIFYMLKYIKVNY